MSDLYLILHKVRGEPAFDIAQRLQIGDEEGWIIPTSGHRAYPYWWGQPVLFEHILCSASMPDDLPDHFTANAPRDPAPLTARVNDLLSVLGLGSKPIKRRSVT